MLALVAMDLALMMVGLILSSCLILFLAPGADRPGTQPSKPGRRGRRRGSPWAVDSRSHTRPRGPTPARKGRFNALVVEDSPPMRQMLVFALSRVRELDIVEADDNVDALRRITGTKFDIIITDINMPNLDGLELVKQLRADDNYKDVPIVIITTEGAAEDRQRALALGANAHITKPMQVQQLSSLVREILSLD
jgi:two-component system chemotaxis response regulator CheY